MTNNVTPIRNNKGKFVKGTSGNLSGLSNVENAVRDLNKKAKIATLESIFEVKVPAVANIMFSMLRSKATSDDVKVKICMAILDRALGKPLQSTRRIEKTTDSAFDFHEIDPETRKAMMKAFNDASKADDAEAE